VQSVALPRRLSRSRSCFDIFRLEPAVAEFDGPFTPTHGSAEGIVGHHPFRPPRSFRHASPCPRVDHSVSGSLLATPRVKHGGPGPRKRGLRPYRFPCACLDNPVRLAVRRHSLGRFSKRTTRHRLPESPTGGSPHGRLSRDLVCPVVLSLTEFRPYCTALFGVLCSVRSRYLFAIGLEECVVFAVDVCGINKG
jgi:hypothetical protein